MAIQISATQQNLILTHLQLDKAANYSLLEYYLKNILAKRNVDFQINDETIITLPYHQAWELIYNWARSNEGGLPVGDTQLSAAVGASRLLSFLQINVLGKNHETAANYHQLLEQSKHPVPTPTTGTPEQSSFARSMSLLHEQINSHNASVLGLQNVIEKSAFFQRLDPETRHLVSLMVAANGDSFSRYSPDMPSRFNSLLLHMPGVKNTNRVAKLVYSTPAESDFPDPTGKPGEPNLDRKVGELELLANDIQGYIQQNPVYLQDLTQIRTISSFTPTVSDVPELLLSFLPTTPAADRDQLARTLRTAIISSAAGRSHISGTDLINQALKAAGLQAQVPVSLAETLSPYLESIEVHTRAKLLSGDLQQPDGRLLSTLHVAAALGIDPEIPWLTPQILDDLSEKLAPGSSKNLDLLQQKYDEVFSTGDFQKAKELGSLLKQRRDYSYYRQEIRRNPLLGLQELLGKTRGVTSPARQSIENLSAKLYGTYARVEGIITWPTRKLLDWQEKLSEKLTITRKLKNGRILTIPLLDPAGFIYGQWIALQKGVALRIFKWSASLAGTGRAGRKIWYAGFFRQIADFSKAFYKADANWSISTFNFFGKKLGNLSLKLGKSLTVVADKIAPGLAAKITTIIGAASSELGIGLLILGAQVLWDLGKKAFSGIARFLRSVLGGNADNLFGTVPLILGSVFLAINTALAGIPVLIIGTVEVIKTLLKIIWDSLVALFLLAATITIIIVSIIFLFFNLFKTTSNLDSGYQQLVAGIVCNEGGGGPGSAAVCIADYLTQCKLNPLTESLLSSSGWKCLLAQTALNDAAKSQLESSAHVDGHLQCVGLISAYLAQAFGITIDQINAKMYAGWTSGQQGVKFVSGAQYCRPGDVFVDTNGSVGHVGVVVDDAGAEVVCVDANYAGPGVTRNKDTCRYPKSRIAGCLKKI